MIRLQDLSLNRGAFSLGPIDLSVEAQEYFVLLGPTGSGKTSVLEMIAGIARADAGKIWSNGKEISAVSPERRNIGMVYQGYHLFPHLTVEQNIRYGMRARKLSNAIQEERLQS